MNINDLKCCGNCKHRIINEDLNFSTEGCINYFFGSNKICDKWEWDNINYKDRSTNGT